MEYFIPDQAYFNIGEASRVTQVPAHTLRYWESELNIPRPIRRPSGHRRYTRADIEKIFRIKELLYDRRLTLAGAKRTMNREARGKADDPAGGIDPSSIRRIKRELHALLLELSA